MPAVCDVLDDYELRYQYVDLRPAAAPRMRVAGPAYTIIGRSNSTRDTSIRLGPRVIDSFTPGVVAVYDTRATRTPASGASCGRGRSRRGCAGAVVDGGIRDTGFIRRLGFPIFRSFTARRCARPFQHRRPQCPGNIGGVAVAPGDYVFGDDDGVVFVPAAATIEVLEKAERILVRESKIRNSLSEGKALADLYLEHGKF